MKKVISCLVVLFILLPCISFAESFGAKHDKVVRIYQSDAEPTAKDAVWTTPDMFNVAVYNKGTNMDGYAQTVCFTLYDEGFNGKHVLVKIIDYAKLNSTGAWVTIGEARCQ